jgi:hypothetical protein
VFTATANGTVVVFSDSPHNDVDPVLVAYQAPASDAAPLTALTPLQYNDDSGSGTKDARVTITAVMGQRYLLQLGTAPANEAATARRARALLAIGLPSRAEHASTVVRAYYTKLGAAVVAPDGSSSDEGGPGGAALCCAATEVQADADRGLYMVVGGGVAAGAVVSSPGSAATAAFMAHLRPLVTSVLSRWVFFFVFFAKCKLDSVSLLGHVPTCLLRPCDMCIPWCKPANAPPTL